MGAGSGPGQLQQSEGGEGWGRGDTWSYALGSKSVSGENWEKGGAEPSRVGVGRVSGTGPRGRRLRAPLG